MEASTGTINLDRFRWREVLSSLLLIALLIGGFVELLQHGWQTARAQSWDAAPAKVLESDRSKKFRYSYRVGDSEHVGEFIPGARSAQLFVEAHPAGASFTAYYNPELPSESVVNRQIQGVDLAELMFLLPSIACCFFLLLVPAQSQASALDRAWIGLSAEGSFVPPGLARGFGPIAILIAGPFFGAIAARSATPSLFVMICAWAAYLGSVILAYRWLTQNRFERGWQVALDHSNMAVVLPRSKTRSEYLRIPARAVSAVLEQPAPRENGPARHRVILRWLNSQGLENEEVIASDLEPQAAERLAQVLESFRLDVEGAIG